MTHIYANLIGTWTDLTNMKDVVINDIYDSPIEWLIENKNTIFEQRSIKINIGEITYFIHPSCLQIITKQLKRLEILRVDYCF